MSRFSRNYPDTPCTKKASGVSRQLKAVSLNLGKAGKFNEYARVEERAKEK